MAEHTYKSNDLTAVIDWDINQITSADEGKIIADLNVYAYKPSPMDINESYMFRHAGVYYTFIIPKDERYPLATKCLLGLYPTIPVHLLYVVGEDQRA